MKREMMLQTVVYDVLYLYAFGMPCECEIIWMLCLICLLHAYAIKQISTKMLWRKKSNWTLNGFCCVYVFFVYNPRVWYRLGIYVGTHLCWRRWMSASVRVSWTYLSFNVCIIERSFILCDVLVYGVCAPKQIGV